MSTEEFKPHHMSITRDDIAGNDGIGRYILLPGSDGRAASIAEHFSGLQVREHGRRHNYYSGTLDCSGRLAGESGTVDVAVVSTGMGCPSVDIIVNELIRLGARRLLRVGTAGSLQPGRIPIGSIVVASAAVRDEGTTRHYMPVEVPAVASPAMVAAALEACRACGVTDRFSGIVHTKDSLYAREMGAGPRGAENDRFMEQLTAAGVLASEMETAMLFTLAQIFSQEAASAGWSAAASANWSAAASAGWSAPASVEAGAVLGIIGDHEAFGNDEQIARTTGIAVEVGLETVRCRARMDRSDAARPGDS